MSWQARVVIAEYWITRRKRTFADPAKLRASAESHEAEGVQVPDWVYRRFHVEESDVLGHRCFTLHPHEPENSQHILYLHGGAYVHQVEHAHWRFLARLIDATGSVVTVPIYPLAPAHTTRTRWRWSGRPTSRSWASYRLRTRSSWVIRPGAG